MPTSGKEDEFRIGFLAAIEVPERGYVGGLLVTNRFGRPLEFQCTTPVKPNRTQEILYGPTLVPFVLGELIGRTLVEKIGVKPHLVLTENRDILEVRNHVSLPVAWLDEVNGASTDNESAASESEDDAADQTADVSGAMDSDEMETQTLIAAIPTEAPTADCDTTSCCNSSNVGETAEPFVPSTCRALSIIRIDSDNLSRAIADAPNMVPVQSTEVVHTELNIPVAAEQPAPAPAPAPAPIELLQAAKAERKSRSSTKSAQQPAKHCVIGKQRLRFHAAHLSDQNTVENRITSLPKDVDLREPFERIREALEETIRSESAR